LAEKRTYEVVIIFDPKITDEDFSNLNKNLADIITKQGGTIVNTDDLGVRKMAYKIGKFREGRYVIHETEGSGQEVAELERRLRVNDSVIRYMTVRVDLERRRADKFKAKRAEKAAKRANAVRGKTTEEEAPAEA
jgi:small subunit ribosomal protein S6